MNNKTPRFAYILICEVTCQTLIKIFQYFHNISIMKHKGETCNSSYKLIKMRFAKDAYLLNLNDEMKDEYKCEKLESLNGCPLDVKSR